jgi:hypothetical protein
VNDSDKRAILQSRLRCPFPIQRQQAYQDRLIVRIRLPPIRRAQILMVAAPLIFNGEMPAQKHISIMPYKRA